MATDSSMSNQFSFTLHNKDSDCQARRSTLQTPHGPVELPAFMPVATLGTVKGLVIDQVRDTGAQMVLSNTYHLALRPGEAIVRKLGGLHEFMGWNGPILTDSGGFQIFSLAQRTKVTENGAVFQSHIDGRTIELTPERSIEIQQTLGSDIAMVLDHVVALPNTKSVIRDACDRSIRWARRCQELSIPEQAQFAIVQGGLDPELRKECASRLAELEFPGYAVGGLSVGEPPAEMYRILDATCPFLPENRPRYLMGVGRPEDLLQGVLRGIDMFDCVMPTRNGRNALAFTDQGPLRLRNEVHARDERPIDENCPCPGCRHSRGYIRHLFMAKEMLGPILLTSHNLTYYQRLMAESKMAIEEHRFVAFFRQKMSAWGALDDV